MITSECKIEQELIEKLFGRLFGRKEKGADGKLESGKCTDVYSDAYNDTFNRAQAKRVAETLASLGQARQLDDGRYTTG
jgi:hypothetical protein